MRVLVVSQARYGVRNVIESLLLELADSDDVSPAYLTISTHDAPDGVDQISLLSKARLEHYESKQLRYLGYAVLNFWRQAYGWLADHHDEYDVVWFHNPRLLPLLPNGLDKKLLVTYHNHLLFEVARYYERPALWYYKLFGIFERRGLRQATDAYYTVVNPAVMEEIHSCGVPNKNIRYIENGVDTGRFNPDCDTTGVIKKYDLPTDKPLLLFLGRLKGQKRPQLLIKRFAKISNALDGDVTLAVAGKGARGEAARKVAETHCGDNIKFLGYVPEKDKAPLYVAADYFVLPSSYEGSPLALYEALASGTPAIVSDLPGTRFVAEEQCGIVVDFADDSDVERITEYITADDDHSSYARNYAETNLDWSTRTKEYQEEFQRMYE